MHLYNLFLAGIWLVLAIWLLVYDYLNPGVGWQFVRVNETNISLGWVALVLAGYNVLRWWTRRASMRARGQHEAFERRRELARRDQELRKSGKQPDPNFIFDQPPHDA